MRDGSAAGLPTGRPQGQTRREAGTQSQRSRPGEMAQPPALLLESEPRGLAPNLGGQQDMKYGRLSAAAITCATVFAVPAAAQAAATRRQSRTPTR
jgi:hypothetical protein